MGYITNTDIEKRLGAAAYVQLTDDNVDGVADAVVVDEARLAAEGEVDSYLGRRYQLPISLATYPELDAVLSSITLDLMELRLRIRRPPVPPDVVRKASESLDWLARVADGRVSLPTGSEVPSSTSRGFVARTSGNARVLSRDELAGF